MGSDRQMNFITSRIFHMNVNPVRSTLEGFLYGVSLQKSLYTNDNLKYME